MWQCSFESNWSLILDKRLQRGRLLQLVERLQLVLFKWHFAAVRIFNLGRWLVILEKHSGDKPSSGPMLNLQSEYYFLGNYWTGAYIMQRQQLLHL
jgi:hypothetical protein